MSISGVISQFAKLPTEKRSLQQLCRLIDGHSLQKATCLLKIFGQLQIKALKNDLDEKTAKQYTKKINLLNKDYYLIVTCNYDKLKDLEKFRPMPGASWNKKKNISDAGADDDIANALAQVLLYLQTSPMPYELAASLDLVHIGSIKNHLVNQNEETNESIILLFDILKENAIIDWETTPPKALIDLQLNLCRSASLIQNQKFVSFLETIVEWGNAYPDIMNILFENCPLLSLTARVAKIAKTPLAIPKISFQKYLIAKTYQQIIAFCPLEILFLKNLVGQAFKHSDQDRRMVSFYLYFLETLFSKEEQLLDKTHKEKVPFNKACVVLGRLRERLDLRTVKLLQSLTYVKIFDSLVSFSLSPEDKCSVFAWASQCDNLAIFVKFAKIACAYTIETFTICYNLFKKSYSFKNEGLDLFFIFIHYQYYWHLDEQSLEYLLTRIVNASDLTNEKHFKKLKKYAKNIKSSVGGDPLLKRQQYLQDAIDKYALYESSWNFTSFDEENRTVQFLQAVENCIKKPLPFEIIFKAFCYPFFKEGAVRAVNNLTQLKINDRISTLFLAPHLGKVKELISALNDANNILTPRQGRYLLTEKYTYSLMAMINFMLVQLEDSTFCSLNFFKNLAKSSLVIFPSHPSCFTDIACLQNAIILGRKNNLNGRAILAKWHAETKPFLEITFLFSIEIPHCQTIKIPLDLPLEKRKHPFCKKLLDHMLLELSKETADQDLNKDLALTKTNQDELQILLKHFSSMQEIARNLDDQEIALALFDFTKRLKFEARFALSSLANQIDPIDDNSCPFTLASKKRIYALPDRLSLLPPQFEDSRFDLHDYDFKEEFRLLQIIVKTRKPQELFAHFHLKMADDEFCKVSVFFHPRNVKADKQEYNEVTFFMDDLSYTIHYGEIVYQECFEKMLRFQLLMLQSCYYAKSFSLTLGTRAKQEE